MSSESETIDWSTVAPKHKTDPKVRFIRKYTISYTNKFPYPESLIFIHLRPLL
jgi:hypothetical protein